MNLILSYLRAFIRFPFFLYAVFTQTKAPLEIAVQRIKICWDCERLFVLTAQCQECWCFVSKKVEYLEQKCRLGKW